MTLALEMIVKGFLLGCPAEKKSKFFSFLSPEWKKNLESLQPCLEKFSALDLLDFVHYSWFIPTLKSYTTEEISLFLHAFPSGQTKNLTKTLSISPAKNSLSSLGVKFLQELLFSSLIGKEKKLLPMEFLPTSPLNFLLRFSKAEWILLIDLLSMYDLINEIQHIVDTKILKKIHESLSEIQKLFLKNKTSYKEPVSFPLLHLNQWDEQPQTLKVLLHKRGLNRLAEALSSQHPDLIWYVCHKLDIGRGTTLLRLCESKPKSTISEHVLQQILEISSLITSQGAFA